MAQTTSTADATTTADVPFPFSEVFKSQEIKDAFKTYLQAEMQEALGGADRADYLDRLKKLRRQIRIQPEKATKDWPWPGAANVCPPMVFKKGNTIYSKALSNYSTKRPFWSIEGSTAEVTPQADALAGLLNFLSKSPFHLNLKKVNRRLLWNTVFLGTQFFEVAWDLKKGPQVQNGAVQSADVYVRNTPVVHLVRIEDFLTRTDWSEIQEMPWVGIHVRYSWRELMAMARDQTITGDKGTPLVDLSDLALSPASKFSEQEQTDRELALLSGDLSSAYPQSQYFDLYKFWCYYDPLGDGNVVDLQGIIDLESGNLLRCEVNPVGMRLVGKIVYYEVPGLLYGMGVAHILEFLQDEIETLHNQRIDAITWAMLEQWKVLRGSPSALNTLWKPGEKHIVDSMDEIQKMDTSDLSGASYPAEEIVERYADQATGANEAMAGRADPTLKSGGGAQAQMVLMQTGSSVLNTSLDTIDEYYAEIGPMLVLLIQQNIGLFQIENFLSAEQAELVRAALTTSPFVIPSIFKFAIETTDLARNEGARKEEYLGFSAMYTQYFQEYTELFAAYTQAQGAGNTFLMSFYAKMLLGKAMMMEKIVEFFHVGNPTDYIMAPKEVKQLLGLGEGGISGQSNGALGLSGGNAGGGVPGAVGGMGPGAPPAGLVSGAAGLAGSDNAGPLGIG